MIRFFYLVCIFSFFNCFSQELVKTFPLDLKNNRDFFQIVNDSAKEVTLFISDKKRVKAIRFNNEMTFIDSLSTKRPDKKYVDIIGYNKNKNNYRIFWATKDNREIYSELYDFTKKEATCKEIKLSLYKEVVLQNFSVSGVFYILTSTEDSDLLNFYRFGENGGFIKKTIDVSTIKLLSNKNKKTTFYELINEGVYDDNDNKLQLITNQNVSSIVSNSKKGKIYVFDNNLVLSFDNNPSFTQTIAINLDDLSFINSLFVHPYIEIWNNETPVSNSYIFDSKILQIKFSSEELAVSLKEFNGKEIKTYTARKDTEIDFKNSDIIQENGSYDNYRVLDKTNQFIRKVHNSKPSITCEIIDGKYSVIIGGVEDIMVTGSSLPIGGFGQVSFTYGINYTLQNLISYKGKKVVYINCLFDSNFNHINDEFLKTPFEKVREFVDNSEDVIRTSGFGVQSYTFYKDVTLFKFNKNLYLGNYNSFNKEYKIFRF